jgi:hypothetical protein
MDAMKYMRWSDALKYTKVQLDHIVREAKKVNTAYQKYLQENPHKEKKTELAKKREELTQKILKLIDVGADKWDGKG